MTLRVSSLLTFFVIAAGNRMRPRSAKVNRTAEIRARKQEALRFLVIGDQGSLDRSQFTVAQGLAKVAGKTNPAAILGTGDNIYCCGAQGDPDTIKKYWSDVYLQYMSLKRPWYMITGNHDWLSDASVERDFTYDSRRNRGGWWQMPSFWYKKTTSKAGLKVDTFHIDTQIWLGGIQLYLQLKRNASTFQKQQKEWLEKALAESKADWKLVIGHHPVYSAGMHGMNAKLRRTLDPLLRQNGVSIYMAGHDHAQQLIRHRGLNYIISGAGGKPARFGRNGYPKNTLRHNFHSPGFAGLVFHNRSTVTLTYYDLNAKVLAVESLNNRPPANNTVPGSCQPRAVRRRRQGSSRNDVSMCSCRRRSSNAPIPYLKDGLVCDGDVVGKKVYDVAEEELVKEDPKPKCGNKVMQDVDIFCPAAKGDGCTVSANIRANSNCTFFCAMNGLSCAGGWEQEEENCGKSAFVGCARSPRSTNMNDLICQCKPDLLGKVGVGLGRGWNQLVRWGAGVRDGLEEYLDPE